MKFGWAHGAALVACVAVAGCDMLGGKGDAPKGQVVATVDGEEVTALELRNELGNYEAPNAQARKAAEQAALQQILTRKLLIQEARDQKLDKTPTFALQQDRAEQQALLSALQTKIAGGVDAPTRADAEKFVAEHPTMFAGRRVMVVDQLITGPIKPDLAKQLQPLKTMEEVEAALAASGVKYQRTMSIIDTLASDPRLVAQIDKLGQDDLFMFPRGGAVLINKVRESRAMPFTGERATDAALVMLRNQRTQEAMARQVKTLRAAAEPKIQYKEGYAPTPKPKAGAPAAKS